MGWTWMPRNGRPVKEILEGCMRPYKVLDIAIVNMRTAYIAFESPHGGVAAAVFLLGFAPKSMYDFGYKDMDESMGPVECDCPERILKLLTAEPTGYAAEWREKCWANVRLRQAIKTGKTITLPEPILFSDGLYRHRFRHWKGNKYVCLDTQVLDTQVQVTLSRFALRGAKVEE